MSMRKPWRWKSSLLFLVALAAPLVVFLSGWRMVGPGEAVVVRRLGRLVEPAWGPGPHWCFPFGIDRLDRVRSDVVREITIGRAGPAPAGRDESEGEMLTGDLNLLRIEATVQYRVSRPGDYVLHSRDVGPWLARALESSLARAIARRSIDAALREGRRAIADEACDALRAAADDLELGVSILSVNLTGARPPLEVAADFAAAQSAESRRDRRVNEARSYQSVQRAESEARARAIDERARGRAEADVIEARAEAARFLALCAAAPSLDQRRLTVRRMYTETIAVLLARARRKLVLPAGDNLDLTLFGPADAPSGSSSATERSAPNVPARNKGPRDGRP